MQRRGAEWPRAATIGQRSSPERATGGAVAGARATAQEHGRGPTTRMSVAHVSMLPEGSNTSRPSWLGRRPRIAELAQQCRQPRNMGRRIGGPAEHLPGHRRGRSSARLGPEPAAHVRARPARRPRRTRRQGEMPGSPRRASAASAAATTVMPRDNAASISRASSLSCGPLRLRLMTSALCVIAKCSALAKLRLVHSVSAGRLLPAGPQGHQPRLRRDTGDADAVIRERTDDAGDCSAMAARPRKYGPRRSSPPPLPARQVGMRLLHTAVDHGNPDVAACRQLVQLGKTPRLRCRLRAIQGIAVERPGIRLATIALERCSSARPTPRADRGRAPAPAARVFPRPPRRAASSSRSSPRPSRGIAQSVTMTKPCSRASRAASARRDGDPCQQPYPPEYAASGRKCSGGSLSKTKIPALASLRVLARLTAAPAHATANHSSAAKNARVMARPAFRGIRRAIRRAAPAAA